MEKHLWQSFVQMKQILVHPVQTSKPLWKASNKNVQLLAMRRCGWLLAKHFMEAIQLDVHALSGLGVDPTTC